MLKTCQHLRDAEAELNELLMRLRICWIRTRQQLQFIERIAPTLNGEIHRMQDEGLLVLVAKLTQAQSNLDKVAKKIETKASYLALVNIRRRRYVIKRDALSAVIVDLEQWQQRFDPSWFLIMLMANPVIDKNWLSKERNKIDWTI